MAWAPIYKVVLGSIAFIVFWVMAVFPAVPFLPIGRTAGALLGAALMVVFQVESPTEAFAAIDLPILGLLFGTMAVSVFLERAELFNYLGALLSWKSQGGKDLLIRVCFLSALSSALFTNDTTCVILTGFVLKLCKEKQLRPQPFLIALASSSNIGSAATPIGNPQNLVIAVTSKISFGTFLVGILPAVAAGMVANTLGLLALYWGKLSLPEDVEGQQEDAATDLSLTTKAPVAPLLEAEKTSGLHSPHGLATPHGVEIPRSLSSVPPSPQEFMHPSTELTSSEVTDGQLKSLPRKSYSVLQDQRVSLDDVITDTGKAGMNGGEISPMGSVKSRGSHATGHAALEMTDLLRLESTNALSHRLRQRSLSYDTQLPVSPSPSGQLSANVTIPPTPTNEAEKLTEQEKEMAPSRRYKICVYGITLGMLAALLAGLNLSWCAITAAVALMVLDFGDAGPSLDQVSYSLLVFFSGMFIAVDGFNRTGAPGAFWNAVEPSSRINDVKGTFILALVVILLSNVASNVPTVLLLGSRVAASAASTPGASVTRAWLILAWVSTVAGNLTLVGSAANLIVSEQARRAQPLGYNLSFWNHLRFGVPSTFIVVAIGLFLVRG